MVKRSVVNSVYNGETCLRQCLDFVCGQIFEGIESICVDGWFGIFQKMLKECGRKASRFRLRGQENPYIVANRRKVRRCYYTECLR